MIKIAPSLASAPFTNLGHLITELESAGADILHFDIEDGNFVPVMTLGTRLISELRPLTKLPFDVHLMMLNPEWLIPQLADLGANMVSVHFEVCTNPKGALGIIRHHGMKAGLAFNPKTKLPDLNYCVDFLDFILILTSEPESQQAVYLPKIISKVIEGKKILQMKGIEWAVDGGINNENIADSIRAGVDIVVSGRGIFQGRDIRENIRKMKNLS